MKKCPLLNKECIEAKCMWWVEMVEKNINTGEIFPSNNCSMSKLPGLLVEVIRNTNGVQAAVESHRNENVVGQHELLNLLTNVQQRRLQMPNEG